MKSRILSDFVDIEDSEHEVLKVAQFVPSNVAFVESVPSIAGSDGSFHCSLPRSGLFVMILVKFD